MKDKLKDFFNRDRKILYIVFCIVLISIFSLTIVYAALSVTLNIIGTAEISNASWNIRFNNVQVNSASVPITPQITNNTTITFSANLENPGDFYKFTVDIVNDGTIDAMIDKIIKTPDLTTEQKKYLKYEVEYSSGQSINTKQILKARETKTISVLFSYRNDIPVSDLPTTATSFNVQLQLVYYQADNTAVNITSGPKKVNVVSGDMDTVGSEICIDTECFYVMYSDRYNITMLSKYNLYVGGIHDGTSWTAYGSEATGKQDSNMLGYVSGQSVRKGTTAFSSTNYWDENGLKMKYGTSYPAYVYDENSMLYNYVENYKTYLESLGLTINEARLINKEELERLGCTTGDKGCSDAPGWVYSTTYWSGTASSSSNLLHISTIVNFNNHIYSYRVDYGVRPVIVISKTLL